MRIIAVTSKVGNMVTPTKETIARLPDLQKLLGECDSLHGRVIHIMRDKRWCPIIVQFDTGAVYAFEQVELETIQ